MPENVKSHKCPRCGETKPIHPDNWYRQKACKSGFDLSKCKICAKKYNQSRYDGSFTKRAPIPKPRKKSYFDIACLKDEVRRATEKTPSIYL